MIMINNNNNRISRLDALRYPAVYLISDIEHIKYSNTYDSSILESQLLSGANSGGGLLYFRAAYGFPVSI